MSLGEQIAELRKAKGWTQSNLAHVSKLSPSTIAMYETNRRTPDPVILEKLAKSLGVSARALSGEESEAPADSAPPAAKPAAVEVLPGRANPSGHTSLSLTPQEARLILFLRMNPENFAFIESYMLSDARRREQLQKTWRLIHDFQS